MSSDSEDLTDRQQKSFAIKPEKGIASMDTSDWPLLLKVRLILVFCAVKDFYTVFLIGMFLAFNILECLLTRHDVYDGQCLLDFKK